MTWAQLHGSARRKQRVGACGGMEFCAYIKRILGVSGKFGHVRSTPAFYAYTASASI